MPGRTFPELHAPSNWACVEFISDLHLQPGERATVDAWRNYMLSTRCDAIFILGDLFEAWVGDDAVAQPGFEAECAGVLRATAARMPVFFMHGNRDFLVGESLARATGMQVMADPTVLVFGSDRWLLTHGDELCVADEEYQAFRRQVRDPEWQAEFLAKPLEQRRTIARGMRKASEERARSGVDYADVDAAAAIDWLQDAQSRTLLHGHTHRPGQQEMEGGFRRVVLSDWDAGAQPPRLEVLRLTASGLQRHSLA